MRWTEAAAVARDTARAWTREAGPGGAILLFDRNGLRAEVEGDFRQNDVRRLGFAGQTASRP